MKFKQKTLKSLLILILVITTLISTGAAIYYFGFQIIKNEDSNQQWKTQPSFAQTEINWITQDKSLILSRFQKLLELKRPQIEFRYAVDNLNGPTTIKVSCNLDNQVIEWFYELQNLEG